MQKLNNRAISGLVTTVFIIFLSISAIALIGYTINKFARAPSLSPELSCLEMSTKKPISIENACFNPQTKDIEVTLKRSIEDIQFNTLDFILLSSNNSSSWSCKSSCSCIIPDASSKRTYYLNVDSITSNSQIAVKINNCALAQALITNC